MKRTVLSILILLVASCVPAAAETQSDDCHVYLIESAEAERATAASEKAKTAEERETLLTSAVKILGKFTTTVGEEESTTKTFPFPVSGYVVTVSVFYTDESMPSATTTDSMLLGLVVARRAYEQAFNAPHSVMAEVSYTKYTDTVRLKTRVHVRRRDYLLGLQCSVEPPPADPDKE